MKTDIRQCTLCGTPLKTARQKKFCSRRCNNSSSNIRNQKYEKQQQRGIAVKLRLIAPKGSKCQHCGYRKNHAALTFHHRVPADKVFEIDVRACANRSWEVLIVEAAKCDLLCFNCHMEEHYPQFELVAGAGLEPATTSL